MKKLSRWAMAALVLAVGAAAVAQDQPAAKQPVVFFRMSIASPDAIIKLGKELGVPESETMVTGIESAPFLGQGTVASDKPLGMVLSASEDHRIMPIEDSVTVLFPVKPGQATVESLTARGGVPKDGEKDVVAWNGAGQAMIRRSLNYVMAKPTMTTYALASIADDVLAADYKDGSNIAAISANLELLRKSAPTAYADLAKEIASIPSFIGIPTPGGPQEAKEVTTALDKINRVTIALGQDDANLHLKSWVAPSPLPGKSREMPRPAFPAGVFVQVHVIYPDAASAKYLETQLTALPEEAFGAGLPPVYHERMKNLALRAASLNSNSDAVSAGFAMKDHVPVFYLVDQLSGTVDAAKELKEIAQEGVGLAAEGGGEKITLDSTTYDAGTNKVQRITLTPEGAQPGSKVVIDCIQNGKTVSMAIAMGEGKYVADLAAAGMKGSSSVLCAGSLDLGEAFKAAADNGGMGMSPDQLQKLRQDLAGQGVTWTIQSSDQGFLYTDIQVPKLVLKKVIASFIGEPNNTP